MQFSGRVIKKRFARGSKSERDAVWLVTDQGEFVLRRAGGNPFHDPELDKLVGRRVRCEGNLVDYLLIVSKCGEEQ